MPAVRGDVGRFGYNTWKVTASGYDVRLRALRLLETFASAIGLAVQMAGDSRRLSHRGHTFAHDTVLASVLLIYNYIPHGPTVKLSGGELPALGM